MNMTGIQESISRGCVQEVVHEWNQHSSFFWPDQSQQHEGS